MGKAGVANSTNQSKLAAAERRRQAFELRKAGASYTAIAQQCGYAGSGKAYQAVKKFLDNLEQEPVPQLWAIQVERLNHLLLILWKQAQDGDTRSIDVMLRVMERLDRLHGLEAPTQHQVHHDGAVLVIDGDTRSYIEGLKQMSEPENPYGTRELGVGGVVEASVVEETEAVVIAEVSETHTHAHGEA